MPCGTQALVVVADRQLGQFAKVDTLHLSSLDLNWKPFSKKSGSRDALGIFTEKRAHLEHIDLIALKFVAMI